MKNRILGVLALIIMIAVLVFVVANVLKSPQTSSIVVLVGLGLVALVQFWNVYKNKNNWAIKVGYYCLLLAIIIPAIGLSLGEMLIKTSDVEWFNEPGFAIAIYSMFISVGLFALASLGFVIGAFLKSKTTIVSQNP